MRCQDCGNQSKKDCVYMRCRTCCKARGFHCQTHVKSTWVSVSASNSYNNNNNNIQHQQQINLQPHQHFLLAPNPKRCREHCNPSSTSENINFTAELHIPAKFRCVRVSSNDNALDHDQYEYQASISIGGHLFKGILYDQGIEDPQNPMVHQQNVILANPSPFSSFMPNTQQYFP